MVTRPKKTLGVWKHSAGHYIPMSPWEAYKVRYHARVRPQREEWTRRSVQLARISRILENNDVRRPRTTHYNRPTHTYDPSRAGRGIIQKNWYHKGTSKPLKRGIGNYRTKNGKIGQFHFTYVDGN